MKLAQALADYGVLKLVDRPDGGLDCPPDREPLTQDELAKLTTSYRAYLNYLNTGKYRWGGATP